MFSKEAIGHLEIVDAVALPFIAFAAGAELHLDELQRKLKSLTIVLICLAVSAVSITSLGLILLADHLPFLESNRLVEVIFIALMGGSVLASKSPSSTIAQIKELKARGSFTQLILGVTVLMDSVVILLFAVSSSAVNALTSGSQFDPMLIIALLVELVLDIAFGVLMALLLRMILSVNLSQAIKSISVLLVGYLGFSLSQVLHGMHFQNFPFRLFSEPMLFCMVAAFVLSNFTKCRGEFQRLIEDLSPAIFIIFFYSTGSFN